MKGSFCHVGMQVYVLDYVILNQQAFWWHVDDDTHSILILKINRCSRRNRGKSRDMFITSSSRAARLRSRTEP